MSKRYCFNKECAFYKKPAAPPPPGERERGITLEKGCRCWGNCEGKYHEVHCGACGQLAVRHDNFDEDMRTAEEKFDGTRKEYTEEYVLPRFVQSHYSP